MATPEQTAKLRQMRLAKEAEEARIASVRKQQKQAAKTARRDFFFDAVAPQLIKALANPNVSNAKCANMLHAATKLLK